MTTACFTKRAIDNSSYSAWRKKVDQEVWRRMGCSLDDLSDQPLRDWYDSGVNPKIAASRAIEAEETQ